MAKKKDACAISIALRLPVAVKLTVVRRNGSNEIEAAELEPIQSLDPGEVQDAMEDAELDLVDAMVAEQLGPMPEDE
jgi:hypothetical protein